MLGSARGRWCNSSGLLTQLLTRRRSFGMGLFIDKPEQGRLVSSRLVSCYCSKLAKRRPAGSSGSVWSVGWRSASFQLRLARAGIKRH